MEPKNKEDRKRSFINFLLLFCLCIVIILTMVFFSVRVPFSENDKLRAKMDQIDKEKDFSNRFAVQMINVSRMLDTVNRTTPQESVRLEGRIELEISKLNSMVTDTLYNKDFYNNVVRNLGDLHQYLKEIRTKSDKDQDANYYKALLEKANDKAQESYTLYLQCMTKK